MVFSKVDALIRNGLVDDFRLWVDFSKKSASQRCQTFSPQNRTFFKNVLHGVSIRKFWKFEILVFLLFIGEIQNNFWLDSNVSLIFQVDVSKHEQSGKHWNLHDKAQMTSCNASVASWCMQQTVCVNEDHSHMTVMILILLGISSLVCLCAIS